MFIREAGRLLSGMKQANHMSSSPALGFLTKSAFVNTPGRTLPVPLPGAAICNKRRAWSPLVHHMSAAGSQAAVEDQSPEKVKEIHHEKPAAETGEDDGAKPAMAKSDYWGLVPEKQYKEDGTPWRWTCFSVRRFSCPPVLMRFLTRHADHR